MMDIPPVRVVFSAEDRHEILRRIDECLARGHVAQGLNVAEFESEFARCVGARHAVAVSSGGAAIQVGMRLLDVKDRRVLVPTNTFLATASGVLLEGGAVTLVDVDPQTFSPSLSSLQKAYTADVAGIILVHIGGIITPEVIRIRRWCDSRGLWLFEDCAHAHGSERDGLGAGRFGLAAAFSFFSTKVITSGEGGMLLTDNDDLAARARQLRDYGKQDQWVTLSVALGANWRMSEFCAAVGAVHLRRLPEFLTSRADAAQMYTRLLKAVPGPQPVLPDHRSSWYKYIVLLPAEVDRDEVRRRMATRGVRLAGGVYDVPLHRQPVFKDLGAFPMADDIARRHICLPIYHGMKFEEIEYVVEALNDSLS